MDVIGQPNSSGDFAEQIFNLEQNLLNTNNYVSKIDSRVIDNEQDKFVLQNEINIPLDDFQYDKGSYFYIIYNNYNRVSKIYFDIKLKKKINSPLYFDIDRSDGVGYKLDLSKDNSKNIYFFSFGQPNTITWIRLYFNANSQNITDYIESISYSFDGYDNLDHTIVISESDYNKDTSISNNALCLLTDE